MMQAWNSKASNQISNMVTMSYLSGGVGVLLRLLTVVHLLLNLLHIPAQCQYVPTFRLSPHSPIVICIKTHLGYYERQLCTTNNVH